jgi:hypothetical protein
MRRRKEDQGPNCFQNHPGPNVTLSIKRISGTVKEKVPFRVTSSGGGKDLTVHYVLADIDILEDKAVREQRVQFIAWHACLARLPGAKGSLRRVPLQKRQSFLVKLLDLLIDSGVRAAVENDEFGPLNIGLHPIGKAGGRHHV